MTFSGFRVYRCLTLQATKWLPQDGHLYSRLFPAYYDSDQFLGSPRTRPIRHSPCIYFFDLSVNHNSNPSRSVRRPFRDRWSNGQICALVPKPNVKPLAVAKDRTTNVSYLDALSSDVCILLATVHL